MHTYRKWVLTLGIVAATPGLASAGPLSLFKSSGSQGAQSQRPVRSNQQVAESVANVLRIGGLTGYDIDVEYQDGTLLLGGKIGTPQQKALAEHLARQIPEVKNVKNQLMVVPQQQQAAQQPPQAQQPQPAQQPQMPQQPPQQQQQLAAAPAAGEQVTTAALFESAPGAAAPAAPAIQTASLEKQSNQAIAEKIANSVSTGVRGYDIEVRYANGTATLNGSVSNMQERQAAHRLAAAVPGVDAVNNRLMVTAAAAQQMPPGYQQQMAQAGYQQQMAQAGYQQQMAQPGYGPQVAQAGFQPPPGAPGPGGPAPGAMPPPEGAFAPPGSTPPALNNPSLPPYAWPSYASYPNYAQVTYPQQYSASAWPYIGPFYPYPQVPLGWRQVQLEWDDGSWNLNFRPRTDRWWWFLNPKNW